MNNHQLRPCSILLLPLDLLQDVAGHIAQSGRFAVLLQPAKNASGNFIEILRLNRRIERPKQTIADRLKHLKLELFTDLVWLVAGLVVLVHAFDDLLVVAFHDAQCDHFLSKRLWVVGKRKRLKVKTKN